MSVVSSGPPPLHSHPVSALLVIKDPVPGDPHYVDIDLIQGGPAVSTYDLWDLVVFYEVLHAAVNMDFSFLTSFEKLKNGHMDLC